LQNARLALDIFLWKENDKPYDLPEESRPEQSLESLLEQVVIFDEEKLFEDSRLNHPELKQYDNKLKIMKVNKRLKFQDLLPKLDLKYTIPGKGFDIVNTGYKNLFSAANQKFGISFSLPLRLREGRGAYKAASLKLEETRLQFEQKKMMVRNKLQRTFNQLTNYKIQLELLKKMYGNYATLQRAEELRFLNGESSVFLVNTRENKTLETRLKLTETAIGYSKMRYKLLWDAGILWRN
jgi:outer membrane protein TolC